MPSGLEIVGVIAALIGIYDAAKKSWEAIKDAQGLTKGTRAAAERLGLVLAFLEDVKTTIESTHLPQATADSARPLLKRVEQNGKTLQETFEKASGIAKDEGFKRLGQPFYILFKGGKVKKTMTEVLDITKQLEELKLIQNTEILKKIDDAVQEFELECTPEDGQTNFTHAGEGDMFNASHEATQNIQTGGQQIRHEGGDHATYSYGGVVNIAHHTGDAEQELLGALKPIDMRRYLRDQGEALQALDGTLKWAFRSGTTSSLLSWLTGDSMLVHGSAGSGKSVLSATMLRCLKDPKLFHRMYEHDSDDEQLSYRDEYDTEEEDSEQDHIEDLDNTDDWEHVHVLDGLPEMLNQATICFFFFGPQERSSPCTMVRTFIHQVILQRTGELRSKSVEVLRDLHKKGRLNLADGHALFEAFLAIVTVDVDSTTYVIVDALDECDDRDQRELMRCLMSLISPLASIKFRLFLTGQPQTTALRDWGAVSNTFDCRNLNDYAPEFEDDIKLFVQRRLDRLENEGVCTPKVRQALQEELFEHADMTFLWVRMVLDDLKARNLLRRIEVAKVASLVPKDLSAAYDAAIRRIPNEEKDIAAKLLYAICWAERALTFEELRVLTAITDDHSTMEDMMEDVVVRSKQTGHHVLGPLVRYAAGCFRVVHTSLLEHLKVDGNAKNLGNVLICSATAHAWIGSRCSRYLRLLSGLSGEYHSYKSKYVLFAYASSCWHLHYRHIQASLDKASEMVVDAVSLCNLAPDGLLTPWQTLNIHMLRAKDVLSTLEETKYPEGSLLLACCFDHYRSVEYVLTSLDAAKDGAGPGLWLAARNGYTECVRLILACARGAQSDTRRDINGMRALNIDVNQHFGENSLRWTTALQQAAAHGHVEIVRDLLAFPGTDVNAQCVFGYSPLHDGRRNGHGNSCQEYLDFSGNDIDVQCLSGDTALHTAIRKRHPTIAEYLIKAKGVDFNIQSSNGRLTSPSPSAGPLRGDTSLHLAADAGYTKLCQQLLEFGACDVDLQNGNGETALHLAAQREHIEICRILLDAQANVNLPGRNGRPVVVNAAHMVHVEVLRLLLTCERTNVSVPDSFGITARYYIRGRFPKGPLKQELLNLFDAAAARFDGAATIPENMEEVNVDGTASSSDRWSKTTCRTQRDRSYNQVVGRTKRIWEVVRKISGYRKASHTIG